jgi:hypothetical protein
LHQDYRIALGTLEPVVICGKMFSGMGLDGSAAFSRIRHSMHLPRYLPGVLALFFSLMVLVSMPLYGAKNKIHYGQGVIVNIPLPEPEVAQAVEDVVQNTIIRGTKEYNKDEYVSKAVAATSTPLFPKWTGVGKVFYKVREQALDPRNFKDSSDLGTLAVRYVVQAQGENNTVLRIDALFKEDFRRVVHQSNGSVESAEYKDIQDHLAQVELVKKETADALAAKKENLSKEKFSSSKDTGTDKKSSSTVPPFEIVTVGGAPAESNPDRTTGEKADGQPVPQPPTETAVTTRTVETIQPAPYELQPGESLEHHVAELRRQVERLVKKPGAPLQSAPFHTATTVKSLEPGTEVLIVISTPYWYGVETNEGEHGWIRRDQLEQVP